MSPTSNPRDLDSPDEEDECPNSAKLPSLPRIHPPSTFIETGLGIGNRSPTSLRPSFTSPRPESSLSPASSGERSTFESAHILESGGADYSDSITEQPADLQRPPHARMQSSDTAYTNRISSATTKRQSTETSHSSVPLYSATKGDSMYGISEKLDLSPEPGSIPIITGWDGNYGPMSPGGAGDGSPLPSGTATPVDDDLEFAEEVTSRPPSSNKFVRICYAVHDSSKTVQWAVRILPILLVIWIPGICGAAFAHQANIWGVPLVWWSAYGTIMWCGWWGFQFIAVAFPTMLSATLAVLIPSSKLAISYLANLHYYVGAAAWGVVNWIAFGPLVQNNAIAPSSIVGLVYRGLLGLFICLVLLLLEKLLIQVIAHNFNKTAYEGRLDEQGFQVKVLSDLYVKSRDPGSSGTLSPPSRPQNLRNLSSDPGHLLKAALKATKSAARSTSNVIGAVTEGNGVDHDSAVKTVKDALNSAKRSKALAGRIYFSFVQPYRKDIFLEDISKCFTNRETAEKGFAVFDRDGNGDLSLEEIELACLEMHRERITLTSSMHDIDSAVGRLDSITMGIWWIIAFIVMISQLSASFEHLIAGAGALILGLSWLVGSTSQEILASIVFVFVKHAYDVGDRVDIDDSEYVVKEMNLLSTVFRRTDGIIVQAPHSLLNGKFINNIRRSGATSETFSWNVEFGTPFEKIELLRARMLEYLIQERRDFIPQIDIVVQDYADQGMMTLTADIKFKTNFQNGALRAVRRNKWCCALKGTLEIYGPGGAGNASPAPADPISYTLIPYDEVERLKKEEEYISHMEARHVKPEAIPTGEAEPHLTGHRAVEQEEAGEPNVGPRG